MVLLADTLFSRKCKTIVVLFQSNTISVLLSDTLFANVIPKWYYFYIYCLRKYTIVSENNTKRYYFKVIPCWQCFKVIPKWYHFQILFSKECRPVLVLFQSNTILVLLSDTLFVATSSYDRGDNSLYENLQAIYRSCILLII